MSIFGLMDCNNFYASCERVFNPVLENKPIVILSNNDGCVIARSNEAKTLGVPMGAPFYQYQSLCKKHHIHVFSSNYTLYGDMSARVMDIMGQNVPALEIYSIDEAFLKLPQADMNFAAWLRQHIKQCTGLPVSIGLGSSKTLAKIANFIAKKEKTGIFDLTDPKLRNAILANFPIEEIWGIGWRLALRLQKLGITTAKQLAESPPKIMRKHFSVVMEKMIYELQGIPCLDLEAPAPRKSIMSSKSFGKEIKALPELMEALSTYCATACVKLREQGSLVQVISVFLQTNLFKEGQRYQNSQVIQLPYATNDTRIIIHYAKEVLKKLYVKDLSYKKTGILLLDLIDEAYQQSNLFIDEKKHLPQIMRTVDTINKRFGKGSLFFGAQGIKIAWQMQCQHRSPRYTTCWAELVKVN